MWADGSPASSLGEGCGSEPSLGTWSGCPISVGPRSRSRATTSRTHDARRARGARDDWIAYPRTLGRPEWSIEAGITYDGVRRGEADVVSDDYVQLTGKAPLSLRDVIALHREELPL